MFYGAAESLSDDPECYSVTLPNNSSLSVIKPADESLSMRFDMI